MERRRCAGHQQGGGGGGGLVFGKQYYWIALIGTPSETDSWQWQWGGHHVTVNATIVGPNIALTPSFIGCQPCEYTDANGNTVRPLGDIEDEAFALVNALDATQQQAAILGATSIDLVLGPGQDGKTIQPEGLPTAQMTADQQAALLQLIGHYTGLVNDEDAAARNAEIQATLDETYLAWYGPTTARQRGLLPHHRSNPRHRVLAAADGRQRSQPHPRHLSRSDQRLRHEADTMNKLCHSGIQQPNPMENHMTAEPSPTLEGASAPPRRRRVMRRVQVTRVAQLSPRMVRVTFTGDDLGAFAWNGPAAHIKLIFPEDGQTEPLMPQPDGPRPTRIRTYTPRRFDPNVPELDVEFVLHGDGPASSWAAQATVGQVLMVGGPGPNYQIDPAADWFLLAGDDAALPAIETILADLPAKARVRVVLEVVNEHEERPLETAAQVAITWLHRGLIQPKPTWRWRPRSRPSSFRPATGTYYIGCFAAAMRRIRKYLLQARGLDPATIVTRGYWKLGAIDYTDHDYGTDS